MALLIGALALLVLAACVVVAYRGDMDGGSAPYREEDDPDVL